MKKSTDKLRRIVREILSESRGNQRLNMVQMRKLKVPMIGSSINDIGTRAENMVRVLSNLPLVLRHAPAGPEPDIPNIKSSTLYHLGERTGGAAEVKSTNIFNPEKMSCTLRLELTKRDARKMQGGATVEDIQAFVMGYFNRHPLVAFPSGKSKGDCCIIVRRVTEITIDDEHIVISTPLTDQIADDIWRRALSGGKPKISVRINAKLRGNVQFIPSIRERFFPKGRGQNYWKLNLFNAVYAGVHPQYIIDNRLYIGHGHWNRASMYPNEDLEELKRQQMINKGIKKFRR